MNENEKKQTGASYIITFYNQILALNDVYARYFTFLVDLEFKHGKEPTKKFIDKLDDSEKTNLSNITREIRYLIVSSYVQYNTIKEVIKSVEIDDDFKKNYYSIAMETWTINRIDLEKYVLFLNKFLINNVVQELLTSSADYLSKIYKENESPK